MRNCISPGDNVLSQKPLVIILFAVIPKRMVQETKHILGSWSLKIIFFHLKEADIRSKVNLKMAIRFHWFKAVVTAVGAELKDNRDFKKIE